MNLSRIRQKYMFLLCHCAALMTRFLTVSIKMAMYKESIISIVDLPMSILYVRQCF